MAAMADNIDGQMADGRYADARWKQSRLILNKNQPGLLPDNKSQPQFKFKSQCHRPL
jgi:hypothetical protein